MTQETEREWRGNAANVQVSFFGDNALTTTDADRIAQFVPKMEMEIAGDKERILLGSRFDLDAFHEEEDYLNDDDFSEGEEDDVDREIKLGQYLAEDAKRIKMSKYGAD